MNKFRMFPPLLGLVFLLAGCGDSRPAETVRLVTYNAGTFNKYIADDYPLVAEMMREVGADAVCLNELDSCTTRTGGVFQLERIARAMGGWDYRFGRAMPYRGGSYGVGVMTRERILDHFTVALPRGEGAEPRVLTVVELARYVIATTHLDHTSAAAQRDQVAVINRVMRERYAEASKPVFLGGDLNALPDSGTLRALQEAWTVLTPTDGAPTPRTIRKSASTTSCNSTTASRAKRPARASCTVSRRATPPAHRIICRCCSKSGCLRKADRPGTGTLADTNNYRYRRLRLSYFRPGNRK